jgi:DNA repair protein RadC
MGIADWPEGERPRERLVSQGPQALSDAELLAIFLRTGVRGKSAVDLARQLLGHFQTLSALVHADAKTLAAVPGMGPAKVAQLQAAMELARRALRDSLRDRPVLGSPAQVREFLRLWLGGETREVFGVLFLDAQNRVIEAETPFRGTLSQTSVYPREIVRRALHHNAAAVILAHNHPSGVAEPSRADEVLTDALKRSLAVVDVRVLDHFVVGEGAVVSFAERGLI